MTRPKNGVCCRLLEVLGSPIRNGYRNKVTFTVSYDPKGHPCVGFAIGRVADGIVAVAVILPYSRPM